MDALSRFSCKFCDFTTLNFNRLLDHTWDKHSLGIGFSYLCDISSCPNKYTNIQSYRRNIKAKHSWFFERCVKRYENNNERDAEIDQEINPVEFDENMKQEEQNGVGESVETFSFADYDHVKEIASFLLKLGEKYGTTTEASCFVTEKIVHILQLENKIRFSMFKSSIERNNQNFVLHHVTEQILTCESPFGIAFQTFAGKKALNEHVKNQKEFIEPKEVSLGFDPMTQKQDTILTFLLLFLCFLNNTQQLFL